MDIHYFPLVLRSPFRSIRLSDAASLFRFDVPRIRHLVGLKHLTIGNEGAITSMQHLPNSAWSTWWSYLRSNDPTHNVRLRWSNFVLAASSREEAVRVAFALKLLAESFSGPYVGFSANGNSIQYLVFRPWHGSQPLTLGRSETAQLRALLKAVSKFRDKARLETIIELYRYAESADVLPRSHRFLQLAIILEMLFLPKQKQELRYRFHLRMAKWFSHVFNDDIKTVATQSLRIYDLRSAIAHQGVAKISDAEMTNVKDYTRRALRRYLIDPTAFADAYLDDLCLGTWQ